MSTIESINTFKQLGSVRLVANTNQSGTYYNGPTNSGVGATFTYATGALTIDSVLVGLNDYILFSGQTSAFQNGIYQCIVVGATGVAAVLQRRGDFQCIEQMKGGQYVPVAAGTALGGSIWTFVEPFPASIGTPVVSGANNINFNNAASEGSGLYLLAANNLSDVASPTTSATNLGLGTGSSPTFTNVNAGSSGVAGYFRSYPATAANGYFEFQAVNNANNFASVLNNAAVAQATTYTLPDPSSATGRVLVAGAALVNGNIVQASGTAGAVVDSGLSVASVSTAVTSLGTLHSVSVTLNTAAMAAAYAAPAVLIAPPLASQMILVLAAQVYTASTGNTPYATGTAPIIQYGTTVHGGGTIATAAGLVAGDITAAASQVRNLLQFATAAITGLSGLGIYFSNATGAYTAGTGTNVTFTLTYLVLTATV